MRANPLLSLSILSLSLQGPIALATTVPLVDFPEKCGYVSGSHMRVTHAKLIEAEKGSLTTVPLRYGFRSSGTAQIYSYFAKPYRPELPTVVYFNGGPGGHAHVLHAREFQFYTDLPFNVLMFDQRGVALSRVETEAQARDARNFGSETTARDALAILDQLGIKKAALYAVSYGTIPATIFASLFPERTSSVVLEGVLFDGMNGVIKGSHIRRQIQGFYDGLSEDVKARLDQLIQEKKISDQWLPETLNFFMLRAGKQWFERFKESLHEALLVRKLDSEGDLQKVFLEMSAAEKPKFAQEESLNAQRKAWRDLLTIPDECRGIQQATDMYYAISIQEMDGHMENVGTVYHLRDRKVIVTPESDYAEHRAAFDHLRIRSYSAAKYPVKVPTFYLQGTSDGATPAPGAVMHFRKSAVGPAQILFFRGLGHSPNYQIVTDLGLDRWTELRSALAQLLSGEALSCEIERRLESTYRIRLETERKGLPLDPTCRR